MENNLKPLPDLIYYSPTQVIQRLVSITCVNRQYHIPVFLLEDSLHVTVIPTNYIHQSPTLRRIISNTPPFVGLAHPHLVHIKEVKPRTFTAKELELLRKMVTDAEAARELQVSDALNSWSTNKELGETTCVLTEAPPGVSFHIWYNKRASQDGKKNSQFIQQKVVVIQNILEILGLLQLKGLLPQPNPFHWKTHFQAIYIEEGSGLEPTSVVAKLLLSYLDDDRSGSPIPINDILHSLLIGCEEIIANTKKVINLISADRVVTVDQVVLECVEYKVAKVISLLRHKEGVNFDHLDFKGPLGAGAFGIVLKAFDKEKQVLSAVKILFGCSGENNSYYCTASNADTFGDDIEYETMKGIKHPNIAKVFALVRHDYDVHELIQLVDAGIVDKKKRELLKSNLEDAQDAQNGRVGIICLEMELCGPTLRTWLDSDKSKTLEHHTLEAQQLRIIHELMEGLKFLHSNNIIHRDIKPGNIFFSSEQEMFPIKLGDFGLSRVLKEGGPGLRKAGTFGYTPPNDKAYGKQSDIFSLGLVIWEVVQSMKDLKERRVLKDKLVEECDEGVIEMCKDCSLLQASNVPSLIVGMTKKKVAERLADLDGVYLVGDSVTPQDALQLHTCLKVFGPGTKILLATGTEYNGQFTLSSSGIQLMGHSTSILSPKIPSDLSPDSSILKVNGDNCRISDLCIQNMSGLEPFGLSVHGSRNHFEGLKVCGTKEASTEGLQVHGKGNVFSSIELWGWWVGLRLYGSEHHLQGITLRDCGSGISIECDSSTLQDIHCSVSLVGLALGAGTKDISISALTCVGEAEAEAEDAQLVELRYSSGVRLEGLCCKGNFSVGLSSWCVKDCVVSHSVCGGILVHSDFNEDASLMLDGVDCGPLAIVSGRGRGIRFRNCRGEVLVDDTLKGCSPLLEENNSFDFVLWGKNEGDEYED